MSIEAYRLFICKRACKDHEIHTHLDLFSGKYCIKTTNGDDKKFLVLRAAAINAGYKDCISEIATPKHIFHADIDGKVNKDVSFDYLGFARAIQLTLQKQENMRPADTVLILLTAPPEVHENGTLKHGMHIVAPYIKCDFDYEKMIREQTLDAFQDILDTISPIDKVSAEKIYDVAPYTGETGSGLRMPFSYKTTKPPEKKLVDRRYTVFAVLSANGTIHEKQTSTYKKSTLLTLQRCTIRSNTETLNYVKKRKRNMPTTGSLAVSSAGAKLLEYASKYIHPSIATARIRDVIPYEHDKAKYAGFIFKLDQTYCPYMNKKHNQSTLYIKVNLFAEWTMGCYCKKYECRKWRPGFRPIDQDIASECHVLGKDNIPLGFF